MNKKNQMPEKTLSGLVSPNNIIADTPKPAHKNFKICCGRAYLSEESLQQHIEETNCSKMRSLNGGDEEEGEEADPLEYDEEENSEMDGGFQQPVINHVGSLQAEDIDEIDLFDEDPRIVIEDNVTNEVVPRLLRSQPPATVQGYNPFVIKRERSPQKNNRNPLDFEDSTPNCTDDEEYNDEDGEVQEEEYNWNTFECEEVEVYRGDDEQSTYQSEAGPSTQPNSEQFKCNEKYCTYTTSAEKALRQHKENAHDPSGTHLCTLCVCRYKTKSELTRHLAIYHGNDTKCVPEIMKVSVKGKNAYKCQACGYTSKGLQTLQGHIHSAHDPAGTFKCNKCSCQYSKKNGLTQHIAISHPEAITPKNMAVAAEVKKNKRLSFSYSNKKMTSEDSFTQLMKTTVDGITIHFQKVVTGSIAHFQCKICEYKTKISNDMVEHVKCAHVGNAKYVCPHCPCKYTSKSAFNDHLSASHPDKVNSSSKKQTVTASPSAARGQRMSEEQSCSSSSASNPIPSTSSLPYKIVILDNNQTLFHCEMCGFRAKDREKTLNHIKLSHGESAKFHCVKCTFRFVNKTALCIHIARNHHELLVSTVGYDDPELEIVLADGIRIFRCKICYYSIGDEKKCRVHYKGSHTDGDFPCTICTCVFKTPGNLRNHIALFHRVEASKASESPASATISIPKTVVEKQHKTVTENQQNSIEENMVGFTMIHVNNKRHYNCNSCAYSTPHPTGVKSHLIACHNPDNTFECPHCPCRLASKFGLRNHIGLFHKNVAASTSPKKATCDNDTAETPEPDDELSNIAGPKSLKAIKVITCDGYSQVIQNGHATFKCNTKGCSFVGKKLSKMRFHIQHTHNPKRKFACENCAHRFTLHSELVLHMKNTHKSDIPTEYESSSNHIPSPDSPEADSNDESMVGGIAVLKCQISGCRFETSPDGEANLLDHMRTDHSPTAKFKCEECPCRYNSDDDLGIHMLAIHNTDSEPVHDSEPEENEDSGEDTPYEETEETNKTGKNNKGNNNTNFVCKFCKFSTVVKRSFVNHLTSSHSLKNQFECQQCPCRFATAPGLTNHEHKYHKKKSPKLVLNTYPPTSMTRRIVTKPLDWNKKFVCTECSAQFNSNSKLNWHMRRVHDKRKSGQPSFKCDICGGHYDTEIGVKIHKKKSHKGNFLHKSLNENNQESQVVENEAESNEIESENVDEAEANSKAARKYAGVEGPNDLPSDEDEDDDLFEAIEPPRAIKKLSRKMAVAASSYHEQAQCPQCTYIGAKSYISRHLKVAHVKNGIQCPSCACTFATRLSQKTHESMLHKLPILHQVIETPSSNAVVSDVDDNSNESAPPILEPLVKVTASGTRAQCTLCSFSCSLALSLKAHTLNAHVKNGNHCSLCTCSFRSLVLLQQHIEKDHESNSLESEVSGTYPPENLDQTESQNADKISTPKSGVKDQQHRCNKCSFSSKSEVNLITHLKNAHNNELFNCEICNQTFKTELILNVHMTNTHALKKRGRGRPRKYSLELEKEDGLQEKSSPTKKLFSCLNCSFSTPLKRDLKNHEKVHDNDDDDQEEQVDDTLDTLTRELRRKRKMDESTDENQNNAKKRKIMNPEPEIESGNRKRKSAVQAMKVIRSAMINEQSRMSIDTDDTINGAETETPIENKRKRIIDQDDLHDGDSSIDTDEMSNEAPEKRAKENRPNRLQNNNLFQKDYEETAEEISNKIRARVQQEAQNSLNSSNARPSQSRSRTSIGIDNEESTGRSPGLREFNRNICSKCAQGFSTNNFLMIHFQKCTESLKSFTCPLCPKIVPSLIKVKEHLWKSHLTERERERNEAAPGEKINSKLPSVCPYTCSLCKLGLKDRKSFIYHLSVPHLFRCKRCSFICGTKNAMEQHKKESHHVRNPSGTNEDQPGTSSRVSKLQNPEDDVMIVFESSPTPHASGEKVQKTGSSKATANNASGHESEKSSEADQDPFSSDASKPSSTGTHSPLLLPSDVESDNPGFEFEETEDAYESMICEGCGHFSSTVEEAREHYQAIENIESLICFVCAYMSSTPCDSVLHAKLHQEDDEEDALCSNNFCDPMDCDVQSSKDIPYTIEIELQDHESQAIDAVHVNPVIVDDDQIPGDGVLFLDPRK